MPSRFDVLGQNETSSSDEDETVSKQDVIIPSYEDLSMIRVDEETVLSAVYGVDFSKKEGAWGSTKMCVNVKPPDLAPENVGTELTLTLQIGKKYPYIPPTVKLENIKGLSDKDRVYLMEMINTKCRALSEHGSVMACEIVQLTEDFLLIHNKDPTKANVSAWEQMKAREEEQRKDKIERDQRLFHWSDKESPSYLQKQAYFDNSEHKVEIQKEMKRQIEALDNADEGRRKNKSAVIKSSINKSRDNSSSGDLFSDDEEDIDFDDDADQRLNSSSRYKSDFVELKFLGRGGGGEVVKVVNKLDRRRYAIKKVFLESEKGRLAEWSKLENAKLRREVTTISRMTHKNIVRYYQAWIEHGDEDDNDLTSHQNEDSVEYPSMGETTMSDSRSGFWRTRIDFTADESLPSISNGRDFDSSSSSSFLAESTDSTDRDRSNQQLDNPLLVGFGFENRSYSDFFKKKRKSSSDSLGEKDEDNSSIYFDDSSRKMGSNGTNSVMYIQMEFCSTTLRHLIDDSSLIHMEVNEVWKLIRQILEALAYIHERKVIHRDLKPGNIFLDKDNNIRLGDFGLATSNRKIKEDIDSLGSAKEIVKSSTYFGIEDNVSQSKNENHGESITQGVGTAFYCAPEQAQSGNIEYDMKVDLFSLGVIIFEMFHPPFETQMERAATLERLRGDIVVKGTNYRGVSQISNGSDVAAERHSCLRDTDQWKEEAKLRFPDSFQKNVPDDCQKVILLCLEQSPKLRPSTEQFLGIHLYQGVKLNLVPRKLEVEELYLKEALQSLASRSDSQQKIIDAFFSRPSLDHVEITFDTDTIAKAQRQESLFHKSKKGEKYTNSLEYLVTKIGNQFSIRTNGMSTVSLSAAAAAFMRARVAGERIKEEASLRGATLNTASSLAMGAATAAAIAGNFDGVHGADPRVVSSICNQMISLFESHGGSQMKPPTLRPRSQHDNTAGLAEVMSKRGVILLLPEDLTINFARSIGRAGGAASNVKRFDLDKVYHKSDVGGHPRESLVATFDIISEEYIKVGEDIIEAEVIFMVSEVMKMLASLAYPRQRRISEAIHVSSPCWYLKITHTKLADAILELCGIPLKEEATKKNFLQILSFCATNPFSTLEHDQLKNPTRFSTDLGKLLEKAFQSHNLPEKSIARLRAFFSPEYFPFPTNITDALKVLYEATMRIRKMECSEKSISKRTKQRYDEVIKGIECIGRVVESLSLLGITPLVQSSREPNASVHAHSPAFISLDLGIRQKKRHYHGHIYFQAMMLQDAFFDNNRSDLSDSEIKIAEGGRYDDLTRRFRPPSYSVHQYSSTLVPMCMGVTFFMGRLIEYAYMEASILARRNFSQINSQSVDCMRLSLGHPFLNTSHSITCIITSMNGFDHNSLRERAIVASRLWSGGIGVEYIAQSSVFSNILKEKGISGSVDWTLDEICGLCRMVKIPFVIIVQPHLLKEIASVYFRSVGTDSFPQKNNASGGEELVPLSSLLSFVKTKLSSFPDQDDNNETNASINRNLFSRGMSQTRGMSQKEIGNSAKPHQSSPEVDVTYAKAFEKGEKGTRSTKRGKDAKEIARASQSAKSYLKRLCNQLETQSSTCVPVIAIDLPFSVLRNYGTAVMSQDGKIDGAVSQISESHPKHKKNLRLLESELGKLLTRVSTASVDSGKKKSYVYSGKEPGALILCLYSISDDKTDLLEINDCDRSLK